MRKNIKTCLLASLICANPLLMHMSLTAQTVERTNPSSPLTAPARAAASTSSPWISQQVVPGAGTLLRFYPQDVMALKNATTLPRVESHYFPQTFQNGPKDSQMGIKDSDIMLSAVDSLPLFMPDFDAVSTYSIARLTANMWRSTLESSLIAFPQETILQQTAQQWDALPHGFLQISPYGIPDEKNAYYSRTKTGCVLKFGYFQPPRASYAQVFASAKVYTCRTPDIVAHETGHYVLDQLRPTFFASKNLQTGGLHEAFGDISALSFVFANDTMVDAAINSTKANLHASHNFFAKLAEEFGISLGMPGYLRNADNTYKLSDVEPEVHAISEVFTGAYYDALVAAFNDASRLYLGQYEAATILQDVAEYSRHLLLHAFITVPKDEPDFADIATQLNRLVEPYRATPPVKVAYLRSLNWAQYFSQEFQRREISKPASSLYYSPKKLNPHPKTHLGHCLGLHKEQASQHE